MSVQAYDEKMLQPKSRPMPWLLEALVTLIRTKPLGVFGGGMVVIFLLVAAFASQLAPYPNHELVGRRLLPPCACARYPRNPLSLPTQ